MPNFNAEVQDEAHDEIENEVLGLTATEISILLLCLKTAQYTKEIMNSLGQEKLSGNLRRTLILMRERGFISYTIPCKPTSRSQKYKLTEKGRTLAGRFTNSDSVLCKTSMKQF